MKIIVENSTWNILEMDFINSLYELLKKYANKEIYLEKVPLKGR